MGGMHLLPCEGPSTAGSPRKVLPGWSCASTPMKACRELQGRGCHPDWEQPPDLFVIPQIRRHPIPRPLGSRLPRTGWGGEDSLSPATKRGDLAVHLRSHRLWQEVKLLASGLQGSAFPRHRTNSTSTSLKILRREGFLSGFGLKKKKKRLSRWRHKREQ